MNCATADEPSEPVAGVRDRGIALALGVAAFSR
jgi:hypothetical protein